MSKYKTYYNRDKKLKLLGFDSYQEYLKSDLWESIRNKVLKLEGYKCCVCGKKANQVHHRTSLSGLAGKNLQSLRAVCQHCHYLAEFKNGKKTRLRDANKIIPDKLNRKKCSNCYLWAKKNSKLCGKCKRTAKENLINHRDKKNEESNS